MNLITAYTRQIKAIGPLGSGEGLDKNRLISQLKVARAALEGKRLRMIIARQAKYMKQGETYRKVPEDHKLQKDWEKILAEELSVHGMLSYLKDRSYSVEELSCLLELSSDNIIDLFKKLEKKKLIEKDRLIVT